MWREHSRSAAASSAQGTPSSSSCVFISPSDGWTYDLSALAQPPAAPYYASNTGDKSDPQTYGFNFCGDLDSRFGCVPAPTASFSATAKGCSRNFGTTTATTWRPLAADPAAGITLVYSGGSSCGSQFPTISSTTFNIACSAPLPAGAPLVVDALLVSSDGCSLTYSLRSPSGCVSITTRIVNPLGVGWILVLCVLGLLFIYCAGGVAYKRRTFGARGLESLPNIDMWRRLLALLAASAAAARDALLCRRRGDYARAEGDNGLDINYELAEDDLGHSSVPSESVQ